MMRGGRGAEGKREKQSFRREKGSEKGRKETIIRKSGTAMKRKETERRAGEREKEGVLGSAMRGRRERGERRHKTAQNSTPRQT